MKRPAGSARGPYDRKGFLVGRRWDLGPTAVAYSLSAGLGAMALTGVAAALVASYGTAPASSGTFAESAPAAALMQARVVAAAPASIVETSPAAALSTGRRLSSARGTFAAAAPATGVTQHELITETPAAIGLTGLSAGVTQSRELLASPGAIAVAAPAPALTRGAVTPSAPGSFAMTAQPATLTGPDGSTVALTLAADPGAFALAGGAAQLTDVHQLVLGRPRRAETEDPPPRRSMVVAASAGDVRLRGAPAALLRRARPSLATTSIAVRAPGARLVVTRAAAPVPAPSLTPPLAARALVLASDGGAVQWMVADASLTVQLEPPVVEAPAAHDRGVVIAIAALYRAHLARRP